MIHLNSLIRFLIRSAVITARARLSKQKHVEALRTRRELLKHLQQAGEKIMSLWEEMVYPSWLWYGVGDL